MGVGVIYNCWSRYYWFSFFFKCFFKFCFGEVGEDLGVRRGRNFEWECNSLISVHPRGKRKGDLMEGLFEGWRDDQTGMRVEKRKRRIQIGRGRWEAEGEGEGKGGNGERKEGVGWEISRKLRLGGRCR